MVKRSYSQMSANAGKKIVFKLGGKPVTSERKKYRRGTIFDRELKFFDNAVNFQFDSTAEIPATGQLCTIPQGDGQSEREGRKVVVKSILFNGQITFVPGAAANAGDVVYLYLVQDRQCNGAAATVANNDTGIFTSSGSNLSVAVPCLANESRFKILKKWSIPMNATAGITTQYSTMAKPLHFYKQCAIPIEYDASVNTGAIGSIRSNNLFLVAGSGNQLDDTTQCIGTLRLRYVG